MAAKAAAAMRLPMASSKAAYGFTVAARRTFTTAPRRLVPSSRAMARQMPSNLALRQSFRRSYADVVPPVAKRRGGGFFRWTWRFVYLSAIAGTGYLSYIIYELRTPDEQFDPDPSKKTLVILGMCA
jgi:NADH:ubiquinone reductase (non-electrogenic)